LRNQILRTISFENGIEALTIEIPLFFVSNFVNEKGIIDKKQLEWSKTKSQLNRSKESSVEVFVKFMSAFS
jgi:hypothetical protein